MKIIHIREGKLKRALELAYKYCSPVGSMSVTLTHPNIKIVCRTDYPDKFDEVAEAVEFYIVR